MEGIKATIRGEGVEISVEFSVEEVMARHRGRPWSELNAEDRQSALKEYALMLYSRQGGAVADGVQVTLEDGTFSTAGDGRT